MNYTQTFEEFASSLGPTDIALYAGAGLILFILFKEQLSPVQKLLADLLVNIKNIFAKKDSVVPVIVPEVKPVTVSDSKEDTFFKLVVSWKQTRDLAVKSGCEEAVKVADQMFPFLSPNVCKKDVV